MNAAFDILDILDLDDKNSPKKTILDKEALLARTEKRKSSKSSAVPKRPENVPREVWSLHSTLNNAHELPSLMPVDDLPAYRQPKAVIGVGRVRRWRWTPFSNSARQDGLKLYHWRRETPDMDQNEDYPFARYNKHVTVPAYTMSEYELWLQDPKWTPEKTAHLMELARRFDLRFVHMRDRWDSDRFPGRPSLEDLKERFYGLLSQLDKARGTNLSKGLRYDAAHERRRKQQLCLLYGRSKDEVEEEQNLVQELRKIEARRCERERKKQDLQKLISQADMLIRTPDDQSTMTTSLTGSLEHTSEFPLGVGATVGSQTSQPSTIDGSVLFLPPSNSTTGIGTNSTMTGANATGTNQRKRSVAVSGGSVSGGATLTLNSQATGDTSYGLNRTSSSGGELTASLGAATVAAGTALNTSYVINFPDTIKNPGAHFRSQKMKLPNNLGQKKIRIIENFLAHLQIDPNPPATAEIVEAYNNLRSKILLLYDLRMALLHCDYELQTTRLKLEEFMPDRPLPAGLASVTNSAETFRSRATSIEGSVSSAAEKVGSTSSDHSSAHTQIDQDILGALREADSKRPVLFRHSLGVAGSLNAFAGSSSLGLTSAVSDTSNTEKVDLLDVSRKKTIGTSSNTDPTSSKSELLSRKGNVPSTSTQMTTGTPERRRRAAALEQDRILKKLKIKGQLHG